jgi:ABC-type glycerol-3-phosphate transport system substrate-binding protein
MKVTLKHRQHNYKGECDDLVYYTTRGSNQLFARRYVRPRYTAANQMIGNSGKHIKTLRPSEGYIQDLKHYIDLYNSRLWPDEPHLHNWYALFVRLMFAQAKALSIPIFSLTFELINAQQLPCRSVKTAVEAGLLMEVEGYERLENPM